MLCCRPVRYASPAVFAALSLAAANALAVNSMLVESPPVNGFIPQVVFGMTDEQDRNSFEFAAIPSSSPGAFTLPKFGTPTYQIATFDTGAQSHRISDAAVQAFDFNSSNRGGTYTAEIAGVSGTEVVTISDGLGIYATGLQNASATGSTLSVTPGTLRGQWNTSILTAEPDSALSSVIGVPMAAQYQTVIRNSQTRHLTVGQTTHKSPSVTFQPLNTPLPDSSYVRLTFDLMSPLGTSPNPVFIPSIENFSNLADNPISPTVWSYFFAKVNGTHDGGSIANEQFLFDTGAQATVLSQDTAAALGYYSSGPNQTTPDFTVEVLGVGGIQTVPGFFVSELSVLTNGGRLTWTNIPVIVFDIIDVRDGDGFLPGILGTNLFSDRDLILNGGTTNPSLGISTRITDQWTNPAGGTWKSDANWSLGYPNGPQESASFRSAISSPQSITVADPTTVGSLTFDSAHRYTLTGPGPLKIESEVLAPSITVLTGSHKIDVPLEFVTPASLSISAGAQLDITSNTLHLSNDPSTLRQYLQNNQLISSVADPNDTHSLAYFDAGDERLVLLAITGDANLDGTLDADDFALLDKGLATGGAFWWQGDFNYDGTITPADYLLLDATFSKQQGGLLSPSLLSLRQAQFGPDYVAALLISVPEPSCATLLGLLGATRLLRRKSHPTLI